MAKSDDFYSQIGDAAGYPGGPLIIGDETIRARRHQPFMCTGQTPPELCTWPDCACPPDDPLVTELLLTGKW